MENRYFTPDIEDIRVGYECEINNALGYEEDYVPIIIDKDVLQAEKDNRFVTSNLSDIIDMINDGYGGLRTPYLTKKQIEDEGWDLNDDKLFTLDNKQLYSLSKNGFGLIFQPFNCEIQIYDKKREIYVYQGECKCINTFRFLNKLFNL